MSTTRKIRCTDCGEAVPYGRLSCPSCGTLLASVAGGVKHGAGGAGDQESGAAPEAEAATAAMTARAIEAAPDADPGPAPTLQPRQPSKTTSRPPAQRTASSRSLVPTTVVRTMTAVLAPATASAAATAGAGAGSSAGGAVSLSGWQVPATTATAPATDVVPEVAHEKGPGFFEFDHLDHARVRAGLEWATALGSGLVAVSLLLPWSRSVIGSAGVNGYFDSWGVAGPGHVLVLAWAIALLGAAVIPSRIPLWITRGVAPLALGVFVLGLAWPYAIGPLGGQIGVVLAFVAGIVLVVTGLVGEWFTRHPQGEPTV